MHFRPNDYTKNNFTNFEKGIYSQYNLFDILNISQWSIDFYDFYCRGDLNLHKNKNFAWSHVTYISKSIVLIYITILLISIKEYKTAHITLIFMCISLIFMWILLYSELYFDIKNCYIKTMFKNNGNPTFQSVYNAWIVQNGVVVFFTFYVLWYSINCIEKNIDFY